jgi:hypothetical protein
MIDGLQPFGRERVEHVERSGLVGAPAEHVAAEHERRNRDSGVSERARIHRRES